MKFFQIILGAELLTRGHVDVGENLFEVVPRSDGVLLQAKKLVIRKLVKHDKEVIGHDILINTHSFYSDLIQG